MVITSESKGHFFGLTQQQIFMTTRFFGTIIKLCKNYVPPVVCICTCISEHYLYLNIIYSFSCSFYIDDIPIRVFRNNKKIKVPYLTRPMVIDASIWDGSDWATDGGQTKIDYNHAPFRAYFQGFDMNACSLDKSKTNVSECYATKYLWNHRVYWQLNPTEQEAYDRVRREHMNYDYCTDTQRFHTLPRECTSDS